MKDLEDLIIYKQYVEMLYYTEMITKKYPREEKWSLVSKIKEISYKGMELLIDAQREINQVDRVKILYRLDGKLKMLKVLVRISKRNKYISMRNYAAWSKKMTNICNILGSWIKSCQKH